MTYTHKNENEMERNSSHASTYFPTSHINQVFFFSFSMLLSNGVIVTKYANVARSVPLAVLLSNKFVYFVALCKPLAMNIIMSLKKS